MRKSLAGPMLALVQRSSAGFALLPCTTPPTEMTFFAQACGREFCVPELLWLCVSTKSKSNSALSSSALIVVYAVVRVLPQLAVWNIARYGSDGFTLPWICV